MNFRLTGIIHILLAVAVVAAPWPAPRASAQAPVVKITVDTTADTVDFGGLKQVSDLPGPDGHVTFREAIAAANNTGGPQTIAFAIPTSDPSFNAALGIFTITLDEGSLLVLTDDQTTIDASSQTAFTGDTNPHGGEVSFYTYPTLGNLSGIRVDSNGNKFIGLHGFHFFRFGLELLGDDNVVVGGNFIQSLSASIRVEGANNRIGGTAPGEGNLIQSSSGNGVWIVGAAATGNVVQGNTIVSHHSNGVDVENASGNLIGGTAPGAGNVVHSNGHFSSGRTPVGANIAISGENNVVQGNLVGVDRTGTVDEGNIAKGISVSGSGHLIGGTEPGAGNVVSGHNYEGSRFAHRGVGISAGGTDIRIQGNWIGTDRSGTIPLPNVFGIRASGTNIRIGGAEPGAANTIALNTRDGIATTAFLGMPTGVHISRNAIYGNGELGINNFYDPTLQAYPDTVTREGAPVIDHATSSGGSTTMVAGHMGFTSTEPITVEIFSSGGTDPSGYGEGQRYEATVMPGVSGAFFVSIPRNLAGRWITATATTANGTSEFSDAEPVTGGVQAQVAVVFPYAGETYLTGTQRDVRWSTQGTVDRVSIRVSYDGGAHFQVLAADIANTGTFRWTVDGPETLAATVTVAAVSDASIRDASDTFRVAAGPASVAATPGVYSATAGTFALRNAASTGEADMSFRYGPRESTWRAITGDWDGNGTATIGLYAPETGTFFLSNTNTAGAAEHVFKFGKPGLQPIAGNWDGDGIDTVGVYDPATGYFFLRKGHAGGPADVKFRFGAAGGGFTAVAGDWDGDGVDTVGLYAPATRSFFLRNALSGGAADYAFSYGPVNAVPVVGDWDGNGTDTAGVFVPSTATWFLRNENSSGTANVTFNYGPVGSYPVAGDWDAQ